MSDERSRLHVNEDEESTDEEVEALLSAGSADPRSS